jgi:hypothetical protein
VQPSFYPWEKKPELGSGIECGRMNLAISHPEVNGASTAQENLHGKAER